jgi:hypothetical protein
MGRAREGIPLSVLRGIPRNPLDPRPAGDPREAGEAMTGRVQARLIARAKSSPSGNVMPAGWRERRSLQRLERRGIVRRRLGLPNVWTVNP